MRLREADWIQVVSLANPTFLPVWQSTYNLGAGEVSTVLLAKELSSSLALIDERKARRLAAHEGLALGGSIAVLESGYRKKYVNDLRQTYVDLLAAKIWIDRSMLNRSLESMGLLRL